MRPQSTPMIRAGIATLVALVLLTGTTSTFAQRQIKREIGSLMRGKRLITPTLKPHGSFNPLGRITDVKPHGSFNTPLGRTTSFTKPFGGGLSRGYASSSNYYNGYPVRGYSGFHASYYWSEPRWYYWTPFHPAWYYSPPMYVNGYYRPGGFHFVRFFISVVLFFVFIGVIVRLFGGGRGGARYTSYN